MFFIKKQGHVSWKLFSSLLLSIFLLTVIFTDLIKVKQSNAQSLGLPEPTSILALSDSYQLPILKGIKLDKDNPLNVEFLIDSGNIELSKSNGEMLKRSTDQLVQYFLAALTVPEEDLWVNLSPYEADRVVESSLGQTELGTDLLKQDYILKQLSSSLTKPDTAIGQDYWQKEKFSQLNKVWIKPQIAKIYQDGNLALITESKLEVFSETETSSMLLEELDREVNSGKHFANLRQIYNAIILALWFKNATKDSFYRHYIDQKKISGIDIDDKTVKDRVYALYCESFKKGVYDQVRVEKETKQKRKFFCGGFNGKHSSSIIQLDANPVHTGADYLAGSLISASSSLTVKQHSDLNYLIADLIGTKDDLSRNYKKKNVVDELKKLLEVVKKGGIVSSDNEVSEVEKLINDGSFDLFFLRPKYGYNTFSSLTEDENNKPVVFNFQNHVGHNSSKAKKKENNIYIATPIYETKTESEKYAMILASMFDLVSDNSDKQALYEQEFIKVYDDNFNAAKVDKLNDEIKDYIQLKDSLWEAVVNDDNEEARKIYKKWVKLVKGLEKPIREVSQISLFEKMIADPVLAQNAAGYIKEIYDTSETVRPKEVEVVKDRVINRIVNAFIAENDRDYWLTKLENDINPQSAHALIEDDFFDDDNFSDKKDFILHSLEAISKLIGSEAAYMPDMKKVVVRSVDNLLLFESNLVHELIHYLADHDIIKIDAQREYATFAGEAVYIITRLMDEGLGLEEAEYVVAPMLNGVLANEELGQALVARGKELWKEKGNKIFSVNIAAASENRDYVSIDNLVEEAIDVYKKLDLDTRELGLYLAYSRKAPANDFEMQEFESVRYGVERSVSVVLRGALLESAIQSDGDPLVLLREYLDRLADKVSLDNKEDEKWVNQLKQKIQRFAGAIFGTFVEIKFSKNTDSMGFFKYSNGENGLSAVLECWKNTFVPGKNPNYSKNELRKRAEETVKGHLLLAKYRAEESPDSSFMDAHEEDFKDQLFKELWEFMTIPNAVYKGHKGLRRVQSKLSDKKKQEYETVPQNIKMVFESLFDFGDAEINEQVYESYPLHLQYLNTLMYIYSNFQGKKGEKFEDPRLKKDSEVEKAILETFQDGWQHLMFRTSTMTDDDILSVVKDEIYPKYKELYDKAKKIEEEKKKKESDKLAQEMQQNPQMMQQIQQMAQQQAQQMLQQQQQQQQQQQGSAQQSNGQSKPGKEGQPSAQQQQAGGTPQSGNQNQQNGAPKPGSQSQGSSSQNGQQALGNSQQGVSPQAKPNPQSNAMNQMVQQMAQDIINQQNAKPGDSKDAKGGKPSDTKAGDAKPGDSKDAKEGKPGESKAGEAKSGDSKDAKDGKASDTKEGDVKPGDSKDAKGGKPSDAKAGDAKPGDAKDAINGKPSDTKAGDAKPGDSKDAKDGKSTETKPGESKPGDTKETKNAKPSDGKAKNSLSELAPPENLDTLNNVLNGKLDSSQGRFKRKKKKSKNYDWELDPNGSLDAERELMLTGLNEEEQKIYYGWRSKLPKSLIDKAYRMLSAFLIKYLGMKRRASDDLSHEWDDVVDVSMSNGGTVDIRKKRPFKVRKTFLLDRSGSMGIGDRLLWIRLIKMLFLEVFVKLNKVQDELFGWQTITYDQEIKRIMTFAKSLKIKEHQKERVIYDALNELNPRGWTDDKKAFLQGIVAHLKEALSRDDGTINVMIAVTDGNFGSNPELEQLLKLADQKGLYVFVVAVGDEQCGQDVIDTFGEKRAVVADNLSELPYKLMDKFIEVLEDKTGQPIKDSQLMSSAIQADEIDLSKITMNGHLARAFKDPLAKNYFYLQGQYENPETGEKLKGSLFENNYFMDRDFLEAMLEENSNDYLELEELSTLNNKQIFKELEGYKNRYVFADDISESDLKGLDKSKYLLELYKRFKQAKTAQQRYQKYADRVIDRLSKSKTELSDFDIVILNHVDGNNYARIDESRKQIFISLEYFEMMDAAELGNNSLFEYQLRNSDSWIDDLKALNMSAEDILEKLIESQIDEKNELGKLGEIFNNRARRVGYRHFYYQRIDGRDYLIYKNGFDEWRWERGVGMVNVPDKVTIDDDGNEAIILEILQSMYAQGMEYTSYSRDGKFYVRSRDGNGFELNMRAKDGIWPNEPFKVFNEGDTGDTVVVSNGNELSLEINEQEHSISLDKPLAEDVQAHYVEELDSWAVFSADKKRIVILELDKSGKLTVSYDMQIENEEDLKANRVLVLEGEPGLGKDENLDAAAHLMGEEKWHLTGHEDATEGDIVYRRVLTENGSEYIYSSLNYVQQNGGIVVLSEAQYIDEEAFGALKEAIASGKHDRLIKKLSDDLIAKSQEKQDRLIRKTINNHIRARIVATTNIKREGIKIEGFNDQAILDRFTNIHFVWKTPEEEAHLQAQLVSNELKRLRPGLTKEEYEKEQDKVLEIAYGLVNVAKDLRLDFMGYNSAEKKALKEDDFANWQENLKDPLFHRRALDASGKPEMREMGKMPRRAPSPRVIRAILEYAIAFPKSWENSPWDAIEYFYNFEANKMDVKERADQLDYVKTAFTAGGYNQNDNQPDIVIGKNDFKFTEDGYWEITPQAVDGADGKKQYWDTIRIKAHPSVKGKLPKEIKKWLKTGNKQNMAILYRVIQMRAIGKNIMLIGDQGTGKSVLSRGICKLLSGPDVESYNLSQATTLNKLLQTPELDKDNVVYYQYGPVARAVKESKLVFIDELTQGRPGVQAGLNEALQRGIVKLYDMLLKGAEGFGFIFAANTPGGPFKVEAPSDEFIERCVIFKLPTLPAEEMHPFLTDMRGLINKIRQVNPSVIGRKKKKLDSDGKPILDNQDNYVYEQIVVDGVEEDRYEGLVGIYQYLRHKISENPDSDLLRRIPAFRTFEILIPHIIDYWRAPRRLERKDKKFQQKQLWNLFRKYFKQAAKDYEKLYEIEKLLQEAFEQSGLWSDEAGKDALTEYLNGEDMVIEKNPYIRLPKTGDSRLDHILMYMQETNRGSSVSNFIKELDGIVNDILLDSDSWLVLDKDDKLESIFKAREIYHILNFILERGRGDERLNSTEANYEAIQDIASKIQERLVFDENLPRELLLVGMQKEDETEFSQAYEQFIGSIEDIALVEHGEQEFVKSFNDKLIKLLVLQNTVDSLNEQDMQYADAIDAAQSEILELIDEEIKPVFEKLNKHKNLHNVVNDSKLTNSVLEKVGAANDAYSTSNHIKELHENLKSHDKNSIFTLAEQDEALAIDVTALENELAKLSSSVEIHDDFEKYYYEFRKIVNEIDQLVKAHIDLLSSDTLDTLDQFMSRLKSMSFDNSLGRVYDDTYSPYDMSFKIVEEIRKLMWFIEREEATRDGTIDPVSAKKIIFSLLEKLFSQVKVIEVIGTRSYEELKNEGYIIEQERQEEDGVIVEVFDVDALLNGKPVVKEILSDEQKSEEEAEPDQLEQERQKTVNNQSMQEREETIDKLVKLYRYYVAMAIKETDEDKVAEYKLKAQDLKDKFTDLINADAVIEESDLPEYFTVTKNIDSDFNNKFKQFVDAIDFDSDNTPGEIVSMFALMSNCEMPNKYIMQDAKARFENNSDLSSFYQWIDSDEFKTANQGFINELKDKLAEQIYLYDKYGFGPSTTPRVSSRSLNIWFGLDDKGMLQFSDKDKRGYAQVNFELREFELKDEFLTNYYLANEANLSGTDFLNILIISLMADIDPERKASIPSIYVFNEHIERGGSTTFKELDRFLRSKVNVSTNNDDLVTTDQHREMMAQLEQLFENYVTRADVEALLSNINFGMSLELSKDFGTNINKPKEDLEKLAKYLESNFDSNDILNISKETKEALAKLNIKLDSDQISVANLIDKLIMPQYFSLGVPVVESFKVLDASEFGAESMSDEDIEKIHDLYDEFFKGQRAYKRRDDQKMLEVIIEKLANADSESYIKLINLYFDRSLHNLVLAWLSLVDNEFHNTFDLNAIRENVYKIIDNIRKLKEFAINADNLKAFSYKYSNDEITDDKFEEQFQAMSYLFFADYDELAKNHWVIGYLASMQDCDLYSDSKLNERISEIATKLFEKITDAGNFEQKRQDRQKSKDAVKGLKGFMDRYDSFGEWVDAAFQPNFRVNNELRLINQILPDDFSFGQSSEDMQILMSKIIKWLDSGDKEMANYARSIVLNFTKAFPYDLSIAAKSNLMTSEAYSGNLIEWHDNIARSESAAELKLLYLFYMTGADFVDQYYTDKEERELIANIIYRTISSDESNKEFVLTNLGALVEAFKDELLEIENRVSGSANGIIAEFFESDESEVNDGIMLTLKTDFAAEINAARDDIGRLVRQLRNQFNGDEHVTVAAEAIEAFDKLGIKIETTELTVKELIEKLNLPQYFNLNRSKTKETGESIETDDSDLKLRSDISVKDLNRMIANSGSFGAWLDDTFAEGAEPVAVLDAINRIDPKDFDFGQSDDEMTTLLTEIVDLIRAEEEVVSMLALVITIKYSSYFKDQANKSAQNTLNNMGAVANELLEWRKTLAKDGYNLWNFYKLFALFYMLGAEQVYDTYVGNGEREYIAQMIFDMFEVDSDTMTFMLASFSEFFDKFNEELFSIALKNHTERLGNNNIADLIDSDLVETYQTKDEAYASYRNQLESLTEIMFMGKEKVEEIFADSYDRLIERIKHHTKNPDFMISTMAQTIIDKFIPVEEQSVSKINLNLRANFANDTNAARNDIDKLINQLENNFDADDTVLIQKDVQNALNRLGFNVEFDEIGVKDLIDMLRLPFYFDLSVDSLSSDYLEKQEARKQADKAMEFIVSEIAKHKDFDNLIEQNLSRENIDQTTLSALNRVSEDEMSKLSLDEKAFIKLIFYLYTYLNDGAQPSYDEQIIDLLIKLSRQFPDAARSVAEEQFKVIDKNGNLLDWYHSKDNKLECMLVFYMMGIENVLARYKKRDHIIQVSMVLLEVATAKVDSELRSLALEMLVPYQAQHPRKVAAVGESSINLSLVKKDLDEFLDRNLIEEYLSREGNEDDFQLQINALIGIIFSGRFKIEDIFGRDLSELIERLEHHLNNPDKEIVDLSRRALQTLGETVEFDDSQSEIQKYSLGLKNEFSNDLNNVLLDIDKLINQLENNFEADEEIDLGDDFVEAFAALNFDFTATVLSVSQLIDELKNISFDDNTSNDNKGFNIPVDLPAGINPDKGIVKLDQNVFLAFNGSSELVQLEKINGKWDMQDFSLNKDYNFSLILQIGDDEFLAQGSSKLSKGENHLFKFKKNPTGGFKQSGVSADNHSALVKLDEDHFVSVDGGRHRIWSRINKISWFSTDIGQVDSEVKKLFRVSDTKFISITEDNNLTVFEQDSDANWSQEAITEAGVIDKGISVENVNVISQEASESTDVEYKTFGFVDRDKLVADYLGVAEDELNDPEKLVTILHTYLGNHVKGNKVKGLIALEMLDENIVAYIKELSKKSSWTDVLFFNNGQIDNYNNEEVDAVINVMQSLVTSDEKYRNFALAHLLSIPVLERVDDDTELLNRFVSGNVHSNKLRVALSLLRDEDFERLFLGTGFKLKELFSQVDGIISSRDEIQDSLYDDIMQRLERIASQSEDKRIKIFASIFDGVNKEDFHDMDYMTLKLEEFGLSSLTFAALNLMSTEQLRVMFSKSDIAEVLIKQCSERDESLGFWAEIILERVAEKSEHWRNTAVGILTGVPREKVALGNFADIVKEKTGVSVESALLGLKLMEGNVQYTNKLINYLIKLLGTHGEKTEFAYDVLISMGRNLIAGRDKIFGLLLGAKPKEFNTDAKLIAKIRELFASEDHLSRRKAILVLDILDDTQLQKIFKDDSDFLEDIIKLNTNYRLSGDQIDNILANFHAKFLHRIVKRKIAVVYNEVKVELEDTESFEEETVAYKIPNKLLGDFYPGFEDATDIEALAEFLESKTENYFDLQGVLTVLESDKDLLMQLVQVRPSIVESLLKLEFEDIAKFSDRIKNIYQTIYANSNNIDRNKLLKSLIELDFHDTTYWDRTSKAVLALTGMLADRKKQFKFVVALSLNDEIVINFTKMLKEPGYHETLKRLVKSRDRFGFDVLKILYSQADIQKAILAVLLDTSEDEIQTNSGLQGAFYRFIDQINDDPFDSMQAIMFMSLLGDDLLNCILDDSYLETVFPEIDPRIGTNRLKYIKSILETLYNAVDPTHQAAIIKQLNRGSILDLTDNESINSFLEVIASRDIPLTMGVFALHLLKDNIPTLISQDKLELNDLIDLLSKGTLDSRDLKPFTAQLIFDIYNNEKTSNDVKEQIIVSLTNLFINDFNDLSYYVPQIKNKLNYEPIKTLLALKLMGIEKIKAMVEYNGGWLVDRKLYKYPFGDSGLAYELENDILQSLMSNATFATVLGTTSQNQSMTAETSVENIATDNPTKTKVVIPLEVVDALFKVITINKEQHTKEAVDTLTKAGFDSNLIGTPGWVSKLHNSIETVSSTTVSSAVLVEQLPILDSRFSSEQSELGGIDFEGVELDVISSGLPAEIAAVDWNNFAGFGFRVNEIKEIKDPDSYILR